jgi:hypothetical protein
MPYRVTFVLGSFDGERHDEVRKTLRHQSLYECLAALTRINLHTILAYKKSGKPIPKLYETGIRYRMEPVGQEDWLDILSCLTAHDVELKGGPKATIDCEDLCCWRAAELQAEGVAAHPVFVWRKLPDGSHLYHIVVRYPDGRIEDPSRRLGMT